ncbi:MAG: hypothetical protein P9L94_17510 [Candidatus Hinthialibacter antarcticus]|nr:hypothetical protein [Candidatus Hinthialibacter antarcticus]
MSLIDESEMEDFHNEIVRAGYQVNDFDLIPNDKTIYSGDFYTPTGTVKIIRKSTEIDKVYPAGNATSWAADFAEDLKNKFYD